MLHGEQGGVLDSIRRSAADEVGCLVACAASGSRITPEISYLSQETHRLLYVLFDLPAAITGLDCIQQITLAA